MLHIGVWCGHTHRLSPMHANISKRPWQCVDVSCVFLCLEDDVVMGTLTVRENFRFSAELRLPTSITGQEKKERVERLIGELGLEKVADSRVRP